MNDIDIEEGRRLLASATTDPWFLDELPECIDPEPGSARWVWIHTDQKIDYIEVVGLSDHPGIFINDAAPIVWLRNNAAAMFDAIETGRQWETIARRLLGIFEGVQDDGWEFDPGETAVINEAAAFRDVADRTPDPTTHHDGGAG